MEEKISVVISNYNGEKLLQSNLPSVLKNCSNCEVIIVDDASTDHSTDLIKNNFKSIKLFVNSKNMGFCRTANRGVNEATGDLVLLLNSDVSPRSNFLLALKKHFKNPNLFAIGLKDISHEDKISISRGKGAAQFKKGFLNHFKAEPKRGETLWVSGGSSLIRKKIFLELEGFDTIFSPFYWEDIDLCWRARKFGYICTFEPSAQVDHYHDEGAIKKHYTANFVKIVAYKNQYLFVWKNISDPVFLIKHIFWQPYHLVKALLRFDTAFFIGLAWAILSIPKLVINYPQNVELYKLTDKEVLKGFEKP